MGTLPLADLLNWGWIRIGPPYIYLNIDPVLLHLGPLAIRWYGLMYVVGILIALWSIRGYCKRKGITEDIVYRVLWWCIAAGVIGGRLYFVIQQPNFVDYYLRNPIHIIATWEGGMAFFGAIFLGIATMVWRARKEHINPLVLIDAGVLFATVGQIFGRIGNIINGDIIGYQSTLPWSTVYVHPESWACASYNLCGVPVEPAALYEMLTNIVLLGVMLYCARKFRRPGMLMLVYLYAYVITQFLIFFTRDNIIVDFLGTHVLKQAQWTSVILFIILLPLTYWIIRASKPVPDGELASTYGIPQPEPKQEVTDSESAADADEVDKGAEVAADNDEVLVSSEQRPVEEQETSAKSATMESVEEEERVEEREPEQPSSSTAQA